MREASAQRAEAHLTAARKARRRLAFDVHADHVEQLEVEIQHLPPGRQRDVLTWAAMAERVRDVGYTTRDEDALDQTRHAVDRVLQEAGRDRPDITARLHLALAQVAARLHRPGWVQEGTGHYEAAARLFIEAREPHEAASAMLALGWSVQLTAGRLRAAHASLTEALSLSDDASIQAAILSDRAQLHLWLGELEAAQSDIDAAWPLAQGGDDRSVAYVAWAAATVASVRGQRAVVEAWVQRGDECRGSWADGNVTGLWYESAVVDALARVGAVDTASKRLAALLPHWDREPTAVGVAQVAVEARLGRLRSAEAAWEAVRQRPDLEPWDAARLRLLLAAAAETAGLPAGPAAAEAFDLCAGLEQPAVLLTIEPDVARTLLPAAAQAGSIVAGRLLSRRSAWTLHVLGTFAVIGPDGQTVVLSGRSRRLLMYLADAENPVARERIWRWLWPASDDDTWRRERLRRLLHRTRSLVPGAIEAVEDGRLRLSRDVAVDLQVFTSTVDIARAAPDPILRAARAKEALGHLRGELLPDEVLDDEWLQSARTRLARDTTWACTVIAEFDAAHGRDDAALSHARAALAAEATNETAAALAAGLLRRLGRRGEALSVLRRAEAALRELDLDAGPLLQDARRRLDGGQRRTG